VVTQSLGRYTLVASLLLGLVAVAARPASAQFLCSGGTRDGQECEGDDNCAGGGVCIIPLGVCAAGGESDGFPCLCAGSECVAEPVCANPQSLGTCAGGIFSEVCCDLAEHNCFDGAPCTSTQKLCIGGDFKGFPCTTNAHCEGSLCRSTGRYCLGGDNDSFGCVDDAECPGGDCVGAAATATAGPPTSTPGPPTATRAATNTPTSTSVTPVTPVTPVRTATPVPTITGTRTVVTPVVTATQMPTETPGVTPLEPTDTPRPTRTPDVGMFATTTADAPSGTYQLQVDVPADDLVSFPVQGVVQVFGESFEFTRRRTSRILNMTDPDGLPFTITAGTVLLVIDATPGPVRPGPVIVRNEQGGSCAIQTTDRHSGSAASLAIGLLFLAGARRLRRRR